MGRRSTGTVEPLKTAIRLKFTVHGARCIETLDLRPTPANIRAAERLMERIQGAIRSGTYRHADFFDTPGRRTAQTFGEYADEWLKTLTLEKSTRRSYKTAINATWRPALGEMPLAQIRYSDIRKAIADKAATVSGKTINNALIPLRAVFDMALRDELITRDPTEGIENHSHQPAEPDPFTVEEVDLILADMAKVYSKAVWAYFAFAFSTGLRPSEQIALTWGDIDWRRKTVKVQRARVDWEDKGTKTNKARDVSLSEAAMAALAVQKLRTFMRGAEAKVFDNPISGRPWQDEQRQRRLYWTPCLRRLKLRLREAYQTRHTFATTLLMGGVNPTWIAKQLGHANTGMLFKVYGRWIEGADKGAEAAKADAILSRNRPREASEA